METEQIVAIVGGGCGAVIGITVGIIQLTAIWKTLVKAGKPGWAIFIPFYNLYVMLQVAGRPAWWLILCLIPLVNVIVICVMYNDIAKRFGGGIGLTLLLLFIPVIGWSVTGFGGATYRDSAA